jgi:hypothetical protein
MVSHDDAISSIKRLVLGLEEIIRVVEMNTLLPSFSCLLVSLKIWIMSDEYS